MRQLRTNLRFAAVDDPPRTIAFTSSNPGEGKSTVIGNLALTVAAAGQPVILIDADLRRPVRPCSSASTAVWACPRSSTGTSPSRTC